MAAPVAFEPPPPLVPPTILCEFPELIAEVIPYARRRHSEINPCFEPAKRRVIVGLAGARDVCLWHSLIARERLGAHLARST